MKIQFVNWWKQKNWQGIKVLKTTINNTNTAFFVCYDWTICLGYWEIRKFRENPVSVSELRGKNI